jgi:hypothetical protein
VREWLCSTASGTDLPPEGVFDAWRLRLLVPDEFAALGSSGAVLSPAQLLYLAWFGLLAPTSHNTVPQRFQLSLGSGGLAVWLDRALVLPQSDADGRQATISCGCAIKHLVLAAGAYGWKAVVEDQAVETAETRPRTENAPQYTELARMAFHPLAVPTVASRWLTAMLERRSVRADYDPSVSLDPQLREEMLELVSKYPSTRLHLITDGPSRMVLGKFQELADTTVFNREAFARELGDWFLPNDHASSRGMRGREFGLSDPAARHFHQGLRGLERLLPDEVSALARGGKLGMRSASAVVVLTVDNDTVASRLEAGQAYAELALLLQLYGYVVSMHAAIAEVEAPNLALRGRLRTLWRPIVVFCLGRPARPVDALRPHSARPRVIDLLMP